MRLSYNLLVDLSNDNYHYYSTDGEKNTNKN